LDKFDPAGCGFSITFDDWQWCSPSGNNPNPGITFGHLFGFTHTDAIEINGHEDPAPIPLQPNPFPQGFIISNH
jgi:hypothetical protein